MSAERWNSLGAFSLVAGIDDPGQRFRSGINDADYSMRAAHRAAATGLRRRQTFQVWRDDLRVVPKVGRDRAHPSSIPRRVRSPDKDFPI